MISPVHQGPSRYVQPYVPISDYYVLQVWVKKDVIYQGMNLDEQDEPAMMVWARVASYQTNLDLNTRDQLIWTNLYFVLHHKYPSQDLTPSYTPAIVLRPPAGR